jgi:hypothetical protein
VSGATHYHTIDGCVIDYPGVCRHLVMKSVNTSQLQFAIYLTIEQNSTDSLPESYIRYIDIAYMKNITIRLLRNSKTNPVTTEVWVTNGTGHLSTQVIFCGF